mgnify:CR=1 FL=1|tara:strand:- start:423 stop:1829 length:1407 start_codon:yes stop_codon:yes gene_type:complete
MSIISLGTVSVDGISTGLKTSTLIDELAKASGRSKTSMQRKLAALEAKSTLFTTLNTRMDTLDTALEAIEDTDDFRSFSVVTEDDASFTATASGDAIGGSYDITVNAVATSQIEHFSIGGSTSFEEQDAAGIFSAGEITFRVDGTDSAIAVDADTDLINFAAEVNDIDGITAYVVQTATLEDTGADAFTLVIQADDTGLDGGLPRIRISDDISETIALSSVQSATNAEIEVSGTTIESASNTITAIQGLTIVAENIDSTSYTSTLALDTTDMAAKVETIVNAFNAVVSLISTNSSIDSSGTNQDAVTLGSFVGESLPRTILNRMRTILSSDYTSDLSITGTTAGSQMGITTASGTGLLTFSSGDFIDALNANQSDVEALFSDTSGSLSDSLRDELNVYIQPSTGLLASQDDAFDDQIDTIEEMIDAEETRIEKFKARLRIQFNGLEAITASLNATSSFLTSFFAPKTS